jgi:hypothetical protein
MQLTVDDQWMMAYTTARIQSWGDVRDDAARSMKKIQAHEDFMDWSSYFLPNSRKEEIKRALTAFKIEQVKKKGARPVQGLKRQIPINLDERAAKLLVDRAKAEQCSVSELLLNRLA